MRAASANQQSQVNRRQFMQAVTAAGVGAMLATPAPAQTAPATRPDDLKVAIIGPGSQGRNLLINCLRIEGVRFTAVCDIWPYHQLYAANILKKYNQPVNVYVDYQDLLDKEKNLDAVIVATPDWVHAEQTVACLKAGKHVYCEKEMSNTLEGCRQMVRAARETGRILQIGHQRRSNPRYFHAIKIIDKDKLLGRITHCYGQWNRAARYDLEWPEGKELDADTLKRYGYDTMERFRNWRWYKKFSGGPMADLGSHQVDVFNWILKARPASVMASGGLDFYTDREWYDNVMAIYVYPTAAGLVRAYYQVLNTTSYGNYYELFMGNEGTMEMSEDPKRGLVYRELQAPRRTWEDEAAKVEKMGTEAIQLKLGETLLPGGGKDPEGQELLAQSQKNLHQLHLENFFDAIRKGTPVSCPPDVAFETAVTVLKANDAVAAAKTIEFTAEDFRA